MYQVETDSEDDYECLFLKPVNGYNMADRIRQANEELFASPGPKSPSVLPRKVTFRRVLEDFEDGGDNISIVSVDSLDGTNATTNDEIKKNKLNLIPEIEEEEKQETITESETEEIVEEIIEISLNADYSETPKESNQLENKREISDSDTEKSKNNNIKIKNRPKSPPLQINQEEYDDISIKKQEISVSPLNTSIEKITVSSSSSSDDDLSVIVSSYIPEDFEIVQEKSTDENNEKPSSKIKKFSFRKKKKSETKVAEENKKKQKLKNENNKNSKSTSDVTNSTTTTTSETEDELKFYYKTCCEYKNAIDVNAALPKYTGYLSEYGLSKEQMQKRKCNIEKQKKMVLEKNLKATECQIQKMEDNERAFTRWLKNKMRFPVNKTKNMFDFHQNKNSKKVKS